MLNGLNEPSRPPCCEAAATEDKLGAHAASDVGCTSAQAPSLPTGVALCVAPRTALPQGETAAVEEETGVQVEVEEDDVKEDAMDR